jgi:hypothetical protein
MQTLGAQGRRWIISSLVHEHVAVVVEWILLVDQRPVGLVLFHLSRVRGGGAKHRERYAIHGGG